MFSNFGDSHFKPTFFGTPKIMITEACAQDMWHIVQACSDEVGWLCVCHELDNGDFLLSEALLPPQECNAATTELLGKGLAQLGHEVMKEDDARGIKMNAPEFRYNHLNCWMHSHCNGSVCPSGQDNQQMSDFCQMYGSAYSVFIRGIANRKGEMQFSVYYKCSKTWKPIVDVPWRVIITPNKEREEYWKKLIAERVKTLGWSDGTSSARNAGKARGFNSPYEYEQGDWADWIRNRGW